MTKIISLQQERTRQLGRMREILDAAEAEDRSFTAEEDQEYTRLESDFEELGKRIKRETEQKDRELRAAEDGSDDEERQAFDARQARGVTGEIDPEDRGLIVNSPEYRKALISYLRRGRDEISAEDRHTLVSGTKQFRDQAKGSNTLGGFLVPIDFQKKLHMHALQAGTFRRNRAGQETLVTGAGEALQIPKTTVFGIAEWVAEGVASSSDDSSFGQVTLNAYTARRLVKVSVELIEDNAVDLEGHLAKAIGQSIGRLENAAYWVGTGTGQPTGLLTVLGTLSAGVAVGKQGATGQTTTVTADDILDTFYAVGPQYRDNAEWSMNDQTVKAIRKLKDATGNFLFATTPGVGGALAYGTPDTLQGKPVWSDPDVPAMSASAMSIVFGDMTAYQIRDVGQVGPEAAERPVGAFSIIRLNERFMDGLQVGFLGYHRTDGNLIDQTGAIKVYKNSAS